MSSIITVKHVSKEYVITSSKGSYVALRDVIMENIKRPVRAVTKKIKHLTGKNRKEIFWALKDINFTVERGEAIGIIGANGAGKSTLLKILSRITPPSAGEIRLEGKVASLLEVGTGFHPELTGRENIFLNGAILGMTKKEIEEKFDQIVEFSGIEQFLDTPVKRYSSGMYVRLAFSVAAHMEPDILLVDEVLAVGDAEFQKKCLGKMDEVTKKSGRTIIFVSHNMDAISRLCDKVILLERGQIIAYGDTDTVIETYLSRGYHANSDIALPKTDTDLTLEDFSITQDGVPAVNISGGKPFEIKIAFTLREPVKSFRAGVYINNMTGFVIARSYAQDWNVSLEELGPGRYTAKLIVPPRLLLAGTYSVELKLFCFGRKIYFEREKLGKNITVFSAENYNELRTKNGANFGYFHIPAEWNVEQK